MGPKQVMLLCVTCLPQRSTAWLLLHILVCTSICDVLALSAQLHCCAFFAVQRHRSRLSASVTDLQACGG
jgi:hypothetical protein